MFCKIESLNGCYFPADRIRKLNTKVNQKWRLVDLFIFYLDSRKTSLEFGG